MEAGGITTLSQGWIVNQESTLFSVSHWPQEKAKIGVVLAAGFSQPMCDLDYFMSKMARQMNANGLYVLQVDPGGHGDSPGFLENVSLDSLRKDLYSAVCYAKRNISEKIYCVGRGLSAAIFSELLTGDMVQGVAGICPYCINKSLVEGISQGIAADAYETADFFSGNDQGKAVFLEALGANTGNLHGQKVSLNFMRDLMNYDAVEALKACRDSALWLFYHEQCEDNIYRWDCINNLDEAMLINLISLARDPLWQHNIIKQVCSWILDV